MKIASLFLSLLVLAAPLRAQPLPGDSVYHLQAGTQAADGQPVAWSSLRGQPRVVSMFYTNCHLMCPLIIENAKSLQKQLTSAERKRLGVVMVSLDPARDTPSAMQDVAQRFTVLGPPGSGLVAKMLNQLMVGCLHATVAELTAAAEAAGIEADRVPEALAGGHADGVLFQQIYPRMRARDFAPRGYARQLLKDLDMVLAWTKELQVPTPMTAQAQTLYRMLARQGHQELDTSALLKLYEPPAAPGH